MRREFRPLACVLAASIIAAGIWWLYREPVGPPDATSPEVEALLHEPAAVSGEPNPRFLEALDALAARHGGRREDYLPGRVSLRVVDGRATRVTADGTPFVLLLLRETDLFIPGLDTQHLVLLDARGRFLDRVSCAVSNRLTGAGSLAAEVLGEPASDGARLVVRFTPPAGQLISGNWEHSIAHGEQLARYHWEPANPEWARRGLCRVGIRDGGLSVVFPMP